MVKKYSVMILAGCMAFSVMAVDEISLSGAVKDGAGAVVQGAIVSLAKAPTIKDTTDAQGAFLLSNITSSIRKAAPYAISVENGMRFGINGDQVQFTIPSTSESGIISIYSSSGRRCAVLQMGKMEAGTHRQTLPRLSAGLYVMQVTIDQLTTNVNFVNTGNQIVLKGDFSTMSVQGMSKKIAASIDTIVVTKSEFKIGKKAIDSYKATGIAVTIEKDNEPPPVCKLPDLPESSGLTKVNEKLPDPFTFYDGTKLTKKSQWECRRQEILAMAKKYVYGPCPPKPDSVWGTVSGGTVSINCKQGSKTASFSATISGSGSGICLSMSNSGIVPSGSKTLSVGSGNASKIQTLFGVSGMIENVATAWMVDRVMDVLELNPTCGHDPKKIMVTGCSGCGKAAFEVGAFSRIPLTVIVESGGGGVASYRQAEWFRSGGGSSSWKCKDDKPQSIGNLENSGACTPWVAGAASWLRSSPGKVKNLPYDQHLLLACIAPRYLCHVTNQNGPEEWCHLGGTCEALSAWAAKPVWKALGIPERMGFLMYSESQCPMHCSNPASATNLAKEFFKRVFDGDNAAKTDVMTIGSGDVQQPVADWKTMWVDWNMETTLE